jgi:FKBP-type peptidyl-prolyl cis-trans isomerase FkpA
MKRLAFPALWLAAALLSSPVLAQDAVLSAAAKEEGAVVTSTGLVYRAVKEGGGAQPGAADTVKVHYKGTFPDGKEFDSSYSRGTPIEFPLSRVIPCWTEGVQLMKVGGKAKLTCPSAIGAERRNAQNKGPESESLSGPLFWLGLSAICRFCP